MRFWYTHASFISNDVTASFGGVIIGGSRNCENGIYGVATASMYRKVGEGSSKSKIAVVKLKTNVMLN